MLGIATPIPRTGPGVAVAVPLGVEAAVSVAVSVGDGVGVEVLARVLLGTCVAVLVIDGVLVGGCVAVAAPAAIGDGFSPSPHAAR